MQEKKIDRFRENKIRLEQSLHKEKDRQAQRRQDYE